MPINLVKHHLTNYLPNLVALAGENIDWNRINTHINKKLKERILNSEGQIITVEACIYDYLMSAKQNESRAFGLLGYLNNLFEELLLLLSEAEKKLLSQNLYNMLISFDRNYLSYVGEIAVLNGLIKSRKYQLIKVEEKLPNGKKIDFVLQVISSNKLLQVEVYNIHLDGEKVDPNHDAINKFLTDRLTVKINKKEAGLESKREFTIVPVLWGPSKVLRIYYDFFQTESIQLENVHEPFAYGTFIGQNGYYEHRFWKISNLFKGNVVLT
jgi:hypothetical protein